MILLISVLLSCIVCSLSQPDDFSRNVVLEHSFDEGKTFSRRGIIELQSASVPGSAGLFQTTGIILEQEQLTDAQFLTLATGSQLQDAFCASTQGGSDFRYMVRVRASFKHGGLSDGDYVFGSACPCGLLSASLTDVILFSIDVAQKRIMSVSVHPLHQLFETVSCSDAVAEQQNRNFNSTIQVVDVVDGPAPDSQLYLQQIEQQRKEQEHGQTQDNRSFLAKYWMYIVPVLIFVLMSGASAPEGGAGGGGGGR